MDFLEIVLIVLVLCFLSSKLFEKLKLPKVVGPIIVGVIISHYFKDQIKLETLIILDSLGTLGIVLFLFYIGLKLNLNSIQKSQTHAFYEALVGFFLTFIVGFIFSNYVLNFTTFQSLIVGSILAIAAEGVSVLILQENKLINSKPGRIIVGAGVIEDIIAIFFLTLITVIASSKGLISFVPLSIGIVSLILIFNFLNQISAQIDNIFLHKKILNSPELLTYALIFLLFFSSFTDYFGLDFTIGAILAGIILNFSLNKNKTLGKSEEQKIQSQIASISVGFLSYFFLFNVGFAIEFNTLFEHIDWGIYFALISFFMKIIASYIVSTCTGQSLKNGLLIGVGLSSKGGLELVILEIARQSQLITNEQFSALALMSFLMMIINPSLFKYLSKIKAKELK